MSIVLLLLFAGALYATEYSRRSAVTMQVARRIEGGGAELGRFPLQAQVVRPAGLERRHSERRHGDRRHVA